MRLSDDSSIIRAEDKGDLVKNEQGLRSAGRFIFVQFMFILIMARVAHATLGLYSMFSVVLGGAVSLIPNACFAWTIFGRFKAAELKQYLKRVYRGEALKIGLTACFFAFVFCFFKRIVPWVFLTSFLFTQSVIWIAPWIFTTRECDK